MADPKTKLWFFKKSIGHKSIKIWMVIVIALVFAGSIGGYVLLKPPSLLKTGQITSVLNGNWNQTQVQRINVTHVYSAIPGSEWLETSYYHNSNKNLSVAVLKFINSNYADSYFASGGSFLFGGVLSNAQNETNGNLNNAPYIYLNYSGVNSTFFHINPASGIVAQHSDYIILITSNNFGMSLQQSKSLLSDQISDL